MPKTRRRKQIARVAERLDLLAAISEDPPRVSRPFLSVAHREAADLAQGWMEGAGMAASIDACGTVVGHYPSANANARTMILGAPLDAPAGSGKFGSGMGVVCAIEAVAELHRRKSKLPFAIEVMAYGGDAGHRFTPRPPGLVAVSGQIDAALANERDANGVVLGQVLRDFGGNPGGIAQLPRSNASLLGFMELHVEQGAVLDGESLPVGIATAISGVNRLDVQIAGAAGHYCTMPFAQRRDALSAAAEIVLATEIELRQKPGVAASASQIRIEPGAADMIPAAARVTIELLSPVDRARRAALRNLERSFRGIARRRRCGIEIKTVLDLPAAPCDARFIAQLSSAAEANGVAAFGMPCGPGIGGLVMSRLCPVGMLLLRCKDGLGRHPSEHVKADDIDVALKVLLAFLQGLDMAGAR